VLYKRRGLGMFVAPGARERLLEQHRQAYYDDVLAPALAQAAVLGISAEEIVAYITGTDGADGTAHHTPQEKS
jgi:GntR family transcriptional regulator